MKYISNLFSLNGADVVKGIIMAFLGGAVTALYQALSTNMAVSLESVATVGLITALSYIIKNFFSDSEGRVLGKLG